MTIVQELMLGYQALLILDAYKNNGQAGQLYLLEPIIPDLSHLKPNPFVSGQGQALYLIVGERQVSPCDHAVYSRFKLWIVNKLTGGEIETYQVDSVTIDHWDDKAGDRFPHLLNPCECGTFLPIALEPGPMLSSAIGLLEDLNRLKQYSSEMEPVFQQLTDVMLEMTQFSLDTNTPLEIR